MLAAGQGRQLLEQFDHATNDPLERRSRRPAGAARRQAATEADRKAAARGEGRRTRPPR